MSASNKLQIRAASLGIRDSTREPGKLVLLQQPRGLRVPHPVRALQPQLLSVQRPPDALLAALLPGPTILSFVYLGHDVNMRFNHSRPIVGYSILSRDWHQIKRNISST